MTHSLKKLSLGILLSVSTLSTHAVPIVNENHANSGVMTIYPDHQDPNRFYVAPNIVIISKDEKGVPYFSYNEVSNGWFQPPTGIIQMLLVPAYTRNELQLAKSKILEKNPSAQFSGVPFISSALSLTGDLPLIFKSTQCNHQAGLVGQEQACVMTLTERGRKMFRRSLSRKTIFTTLQFEYALQAVIRLADGSFRDEVVRHGIAARIDGGQLAPFPYLIQKK